MGISLIKIDVLFMENGRIDPKLEGNETMKRTYTFLVFFFFTSVLLRKYLPKLCGDRKYRDRKRVKSQSKSYIMKLGLITNFRPLISNLDLLFRNAERKAV